MIATFFVFRFVINHRIFNFHFAGREVPLEIFHIGGSIPQTPFYKRKDFEFFYFIRGVPECKLLNFCPGFQGYKIQSFSFHTILHTFDGAVIHPMTTFVAIQLRFAGLPTRAPHRFSIVDIKILSATIHRYIIVTITRNTTELGIFIKRISSSSIGN